MTVALEQRSQLDQVIDACAVGAESCELTTWHRLGGDITPLPATPLIVDRENQRIECILPADCSPDLYGFGLERLVSQGWEINIVAPAYMMGQAHRAFRGLGVLIQPWWQDGQNIHFGRPEIP